MVLVGELRDMDTLRIALRAADTGHQVFSTVHSASAPQTVERIVAMFPPAEHKLLLTQLAGNLEAIISQRLVLRGTGRGGRRRKFCAAGRCRRNIFWRGERWNLGDYIKSGGNGQQTFDQNLLQMFQQELITHSEAIQNATNRESLEMSVRGIGSAKSAMDASGGRPKPIGPPR